MTSASQVPPAERLIGQLVADTLRFYGGHFWSSLALGVAPAVVVAVASQFDRSAAVAISAGGAVIAATASYVAASAMVAGTRPSGRTILTAFAAGVVVYIPALLLLGLIVPGLAWLALFGLAVPAAVSERLAFVQSLRRGFELGRAGFVHALGTLCTLALLVFVTGQVMILAIYGASGQAIQVTAFLATLVLTPILFLGAAHLYEDQVARAEVKSGRQRAKEA
ncbi:MAG TPA: hypothetical protein VFR32_09215 [Gaiellaceae bacterium]|nr:hypothetical protein [Gaiellaceae bacterium]